MLEVLHPHSLSTVAHTVVSPFNFASFTCNMKLEEHTVALSLLMKEKEETCQFRKIAGLRSFFFRLEEISISLYKGSMKEWVEKILKLWGRKISAVARS